MLVPVDMICGPDCDSISGCLYCNFGAGNPVQGRSGKEE